MMKRSFSVLATLLFLFGLAANAQDFYEKKPWTEWSESTAQRVTEDSPWANKYTDSQVIVQQTSTDANSRDREATNEISYVASLRSALPIRQAIVRMRQTQMKYDKMTPEQKKQIDDQAKQFLDQTYPDSIVVNVHYGSNVVDFARQLRSYWQAQTLDSQKNSVFLVTGSGKRIPLAQFQVVAGGGAEFYYIFPRNDEKGEAYVSRDEKKLGLEFVHPDDIGNNNNSSATTVGGRSSGQGSPAGQIGTSATTTALKGNVSGKRVFLQFKPAKFTYAGNFTY
jgi:hypothetical protein